MIEIFRLELLSFIFEINLINEIIQIALHVANKENATRIAHALFGLKMKEANYKRTLKQFSIL